MDEECVKAFSNALVHHETYNAFLPINVERNIGCSSNPLQSVSFLMV